MNMNAMAAAVARLRLASSRGRRSGSGLRRSTTAKTTSSRAPPRPGARISGVPQPRSGPWTSAKTTSVTPSVALSAPGRSKRRPAVAFAVGGEQPEGQRDRDRDQRHVDEEHRLPAEHLREHAAEQHTDHQAGRSRAAPHGQRAVALTALGEGRVDQRQRGGEDQRSAEPLGGSRRQLDFGHRRQPADEGGDAVQRQPGDEDPAVAEQVGGAAAEQEEAGRGDRIRADHRLQRLRGVAEVARDLGQRDHDDVLVERDDQHGERQQGQGRSMAGAAR